MLNSSSNSRHVTRNPAAVRPIRRAASRDAVTRNNNNSINNTTTAHLAATQRRRELLSRLQHSLVASAEDADHGGAHSSSHPPGIAQNLRHEREQQLFAGETGSPHSVPIRHTVHGSPIVSDSSNKNNAARRHRDALRNAASGVVQHHSLFSVERLCKQGEEDLSYRRNCAQFGTVSPQRETRFMQDKVQRLWEEERAADQQRAMHTLEGTELALLAYRALSKQEKDNATHKNIKVARRLTGDEVNREEHQTLTAAALAHAAMLHQQQGQQREQQPDRDASAERNCAVGSGRRTKMLRGLYNNASQSLSILDAVQQNPLPQQKQRLPPTPGVINEHPPSQQQHEQEQQQQQVQEQDVEAVEESRRIRDAFRQTRDERWPMDVRAIAQSVHLIDKDAPVVPLLPAWFEQTQKHYIVNAQQHRSAFPNSGPFAVNGNSPQQQQQQRHSQEREEFMQQQQQQPSSQRNHQQQQPQHSTATQTYLDSLIHIPDALVNEIERKIERTVHEKLARERYWRSVRDPFKYGRNNRNGNNQNGRLNELYKPMKAPGTERILAERRQQQAEHPQQQPQDPNRVRYGFEWQRYSWRDVDPESYYNIDDLPPPQSHGNNNGRNYAQAQAKVSATLRQHIERVRADADEQEKRLQQQARRLQQQQQQQQRGAAGTPQPKPQQQRDATSAAAAAAVEVRPLRRTTQTPQPKPAAAVAAVKPKPKPKAKATSTTTAKPEPKKAEPERTRRGSIKVVSATSAADGAADTNGSLVVQQRRSGSAVSSSSRRSVRSASGGVDGGGGFNNSATVNSIQTDAHPNTTNVKPKAESVQQQQQAATNTVDVERSPSPVAANPQPIVATSNATAVAAVSSTTDVAPIQAQPPNPQLAAALLRAQLSSAGSSNNNDSNDKNSNTKLSPNSTNKHQSAQQQQQRQPSIGATSSNNNNSAGEFATLTGEAPPKSPNLQQQQPQHSLTTAKMRMLDDSIEDVNIFKQSSDVASHGGVAVRHEGIGAAAATAKGNNNNNTNNPNITVIREYDIEVPDLTKRKKKTTGATTAANDPEAGRCEIPIPHQQQQQHRPGSSMSTTSVDVPPLVNNNNPRLNSQGSVATTTSTSSGHHGSVMECDIPIAEWDTPAAGGKQQSGAKNNSKVNRKMKAAGGGFGDDFEASSNSDSSDFSDVDESIPIPPVSAAAAAATTTAEAAALASLLRNQRAGVASAQSNHSGSSIVDETQPHVSPPAAGGAAAVARPASSSRQQQQNANRRQRKPENERLNL